MNTFTAWREDLTWREQLTLAAGFFNGEGCIGLYRGGPYTRTPRISLSQKDPRELYRFLEIVGLGYIYHRPPRRGLNKISDYTIGNHAPVQAIIAMLWLGLSEAKREQAIRVLSAWRIDQRAHRNRSKYRTECPHGHPYSEENTEWRTDKYGVTRRHCLACRREVYPQAKREAAKRRLAVVMLESV